MTNPLLPQTSLDAVNQMLASIGQTPLNSLNTTGIRDAAIAELALNNTTREVLTRGWSFNTDRAFRLTPDINGNIIVPADSLSIDPCDPGTDLIERYNNGTRMLYDTENHTFVIDESEVEVDIVRAMSFETIPQAARGYIAIRAARVFQANVIGSDILFRYTELHEREAKRILMRNESRNRDRNMFDNPDLNVSAMRRRNPPR